MIDDFLCRALRGEPAPWASLSKAGPPEFLERCRQHGIAALLFHRMREHSAWHDWPPEVRQSLEQASRAGVAQELLSTHYLKQLIQAFAERNIPCLLMKGEAMAVTVYPEAGTRSRSDSDLFIQIRDIEAARRAVLDLGYEIVSPVYKSRQFTVLRPGDRTGNVRFDIHWRILNSPRFARAFSFQEAWERSVQAPEMEPARMLSVVDALILACMHRLGSDRHDADRLIWLHDIHALSTRMDGEEPMRFATLAVEKGVQDVCLEGVQRAGTCFGGSCPREVVDLLKTPGSQRSQSPLGVLMQDWRELPADVGRPGLLKELFLPSRSHLLQKYGKRNLLWFPVLYVWQVLGGICNRIIAR